MDYRHCLECDTPYPTARSLRRAHRATARRVYGKGMWRTRWRAYFTTARSIRLCPRCLHDL